MVANPSRISDRRKERSAQTVERERAIGTEASNTLLKLNRHNVWLNQPVASFRYKTIASEEAVLLAFDRSHAEFG